MSTDRGRLTMSVREAAKLTGLTEGFIRRGIKAGKIPVVTSGRLIRVLRVPLLRLLGVELNEAS